MRAAAVLVALLLLIGAIGGAAYYFTAINPVDKYIPKGLDIAGGVRLVLQGVDTPEAPVTGEAMARALEIIRYRVDKLGVSEPVLQLEESRHRIIVELAGVHDPVEAARVIGRTAQLKFVAPGPNGEVAGGDVILTGSDLDRAAVVPGVGGGYAVTLQLTSEGARKFAEATQQYRGQQIAILLDDEVVSAPVVREVIPNGQAEITGDFTDKEAKQLADILNGGALPVKLEIIETRQVSATLGQDSFHRILRAGLYSLIGVVAFMLLLYRLPGLMAIVALAVYIGLTVAVLVGLRAVLTLPGIAGIILSIAMAVDANVLIFERCKEELRKGKPLRAAVRAGFERAYSAVLDSNLTTILAAVILYYFGTGPVKGFGLTLGIGVVISMFTAITLSRWLLQALVSTGLFTGRTLFGVRQEVQA